MNLPLSFLAVFLSAATAFAESWLTVEQLAVRASLIVHARADQTADGPVQFAVIETWKGAYSPRAFDPEAPPGLIRAQDKRVLTGEVVLFFMAPSTPAGKYTWPDLVVPIADGAITYPGSTANPGEPKSYPLAAFRTALQTSAKVPLIKTPLVNGDFEKSPVGSMPEGWKAAYPTGHAAVATDGKDVFVRLTTVQVENAGVAQMVPVPAKSTHVAVMGRMRGKPKNERGEKRAAVQVALGFRDARGGMINAGVVASEGSAYWRTFRREFQIPPGCAQVEVSARSIFAIGTFDFDTVRVEFK